MDHLPLSYTTMFLDHDLLLAQHSGVATVWLLSTLGNKASYKKISRKEIQSVSIPQACDVIKNPPAPMALRLTSNLLYGVALIYKQKIDYLNNDTSLIKTKIQRDLFNQSSGNGDVLIKTPNYITKPIELTKSIQGGNRKTQVLLNDDPFFNVEGDLLPSLDGLDFLQGVASTQVVDSNNRKSQIRRSDLDNNTVSVVLSTLTNSTDDGEVFTKHVNNDDILDSENPEFAFDEEGMLLNLHDETTGGAAATTGTDVVDDFDLDFDFNLDMERQTLPQQPQGNELDQILEEVEDVQQVEAPPPDPAELDAEPVRKRRRVRTHFSRVITDDSISLQTNDLRGFRDAYVEAMEARRSKTPEVVTIQSLLDNSSYLPVFNKDPATIISIDQERHSINPVGQSGEDEDFVDGLLRNSRRSSESIEVRRNTSSTRRHSTRASMSSINLPLEGGIPGADEQQQNEETIGDNFDFDFDFDFDEERKKRSSSVQRFSALEENEEHVHQGGDIHRHDQQSGYEVDKKTIKFMTFIETRFEEESVDEMQFGQLIQQQDRSIIVKSFYEILQLTTLSSIEIVKSTGKDKFDLLGADDFSVRLV